VQLWQEVGAYFGVIIVTSLPRGQYGRCGPTHIEQGDGKAKKKTLGPDGKSCTAGNIGSPCLRRNEVNRTLPAEQLILCLWLSGWPAQ
jgi:hypothetical protein